MTEPRTFDPNDYMIKIELPRVLELDHEYYGIYENQKGRILAEAENGQILEIGSLDLYYMQPSKGDDFISIADGEEADFGAAAIDVFDVKTGMLREEISSFYGEMDFEAPDFLYIRRIELKPEYRGHGIGKRCMEALLKLYEFPTCSLVIVKPFPIELLKDDRSEDKKLVAEGTNRLTRFYERLGFRKTASEHMTYCTLLNKQPSFRTVRAGSHRRQRSPAPTESAREHRSPGH